MQKVAVNIVRLHSTYPITSVFFLRTSPCNSVLVNEIQYRAIVIESDKYWHFINTGYASE